MATGVGAGVTCWRVWASGFTVAACVGLVGSQKALVYFIIRRSTRMKQGRTYRLRRQPKPTKATVAKP